MNMLFYIDFQKQEISKILLGLNDVEYIRNILTKKPDAEDDIRLELISQYQIRMITYSTLEKKIQAEKILPLKMIRKYKLHNPTAL